MATGKLARKLLKDLSKFNEKEATRKELIKQQGQILVVDFIVFKEILQQLFPKMENTIVDKIWTDWSAYLSTQSKNIKKKQRLQELVEVKKEILLAPTEHAFIIGSYDTIKKAKSGNGKLGNIVKKHYSKAKKEELKQIGGQGDKSGAQLGHEEAGRGLGSSAVKVLKAESALARLSGSDNPVVKKIIQDTKNMLNVRITHEQILTKNGKLRKKYTPILTWQKAVDNQTAKLNEEAAINFLNEQLKNLAEEPGSTPLGEAVGQILLGNIVPRGARSQGIKKTQIKEKNSTEVGKQSKQRRKSTVIKDSGIAAKSFIQKDKEASRKKSMFSVMTLINKRLPETLEKNMRAPGLENRTGRFANSVRLIDVSQTAKGFPSFGYTYQKDPYQVFEVGKGRSPWATPERDPRLVIDSSIREVAAEMALGRFYTRRL